VLQFVVLLAGLMVVFNAFFYLYLSKASIFESYLRVNAQASAAALRVFGEQASAEANYIRSPRFSLQIKTGCDAIQASAFLVFIVLASPVAMSWLARLPAVAVGIALLLTLNLARVVTLYYVGVYYPRAFDAIHVEVWQPVFIFLPLFFWFVWLRRAMRGEAVRTHAAD